MRLPLAEWLFVAGLLSLSSCRGRNIAESARNNCSDVKAVKCSTLQVVISPSHDYEAVSKIDSFGGGFGTGYDSADVYMTRVGRTRADTLLFSIEDNADDLSRKNFTIAWLSPDQLEIRYGHGDITFQVVKFSNKTVAAVHDASLDQVARQ